MGGAMAAVKEHDKIEECSRYFVSWAWMIGIIISLSGAVIAGVMMYAPLEAKQDAILSDHEKRIVEMHGVQENLDTIKTILRAR
jgi:H+/gluconate symporter-like permease